MAEKLKYVDSKKLRRIPKVGTVLEEAAATLNTS
jgi:hypothetical protein